MNSSVVLKLIKVKVEIFFKLLVDHFDNEKFQVRELFKHRDKANV